MTPRPLYRWKGCWLGMLVACFVIWAWWDSLNFSSWCMWRQAHVGNGSGGIWLKQETMYSAKLSWTRKPHVPPLGLEPMAFEAPFFVRGGGMNTINNDPDARPKTFRDFYLQGIRLFPRENWLLFIPHWLVLSAFLVPWSSFLIYRARKRINDSN